MPETNRVPRLEAPAPRPRKYAVSYTHLDVYKRQVKDFGKAADAVPVIGAVLGLTFKAVILDGLDFLDSMFLLTASAGELLKVIGDTSLKGVKRKAIIAPAPDGETSLFLTEYHPLGLGEQEGDMALSLIHIYKIIF